ncbi:MAG: NADH-quinone oxidoreductase subunit A [Cyanobacteria bacterium TGS_CYA1]|nr:NADH-quinone oxidoreductase subunit A [Cyanobacteria bacterium TGS_CYA1]MDX2106336.1 NADH-quinone oxidoreductase subunit A [Candidatus Melainabacteria bacterium]
MYELQLSQIFIFVLVGFALPALGMILLAWVLQLVLGYHTPNPIKNQPYECGMKPIQEAILQFDIRYYLYALLFILFDIEIIFIIPWALSTDRLPAILGKGAWWLGPAEIGVFMFILVFGLAYAWKKGALEWDP